MHELIDLLVDGRDSEARLPHARALIQGEP
jgi:hypothetical protein